MIPPFNNLPFAVQLGAFLVLLIISTIMMCILHTMEKPLRASGAGIVAFELAANLQSSQEIIQRWRAAGHLQRAINHMWIDFGFILVYSLTLVLGCGLTASYHVHKGCSELEPVGFYLAVGQILAGVLDVIENCALLRLLHGSNNAWLPPVARWCAMFKFGLICLGLLYTATFVLAAIRRNPN